jgi:acyl-CoA synthetase (AMP-forming)/AMP-acid ligase II
MQRAADLHGAASIGEIIFRNARRFESKTALLSSSGHQTSFRDLKRRVESLVGGLQSLGLKKGSRVAILSRNRPEFFEAVCVSAGGMVAVPLNWRLNEEEITYILRDCQPEALLVDPDFVGMEAAFRGALEPSAHLVSFAAERAGWLSYEELLERGSPGAFDDALDPDQTACIVYTSGTTGRPKGAELSHRGLLLNCRAAIEEVLGLTSDDVSLAPMPFFHVGGLWYHMFPSFAAGCTTVVLPGFEAGAVLEAIERHGITNLHLVPTMLHALLEAPSFASADLSSLRLVFYAASSIPPALLSRAMQALPSIGFVQGYGSTEAGMVSCLTEADHRKAVLPGTHHLLLSCGRALNGVQVDLMHVADGMGEIGVRSDMKMKRYWRNPEATGKTIRDGVLLTGDLGYADADGYLYLQDRRSDMIVTGGENVYPREVEEALIKDERLAEVAVFDLPDDKWVQKVVAAVVPKQGVILDAVTVMESARQRLAGFKCPKQVFVLESLPHNAAGKVLRKELRRMFAVSSRT